ncbi:hypothetical protein TPHA_0I02580 [Tetrapisispora phaffii CBS 4417]|uniref:MICOS complex subunit MIC12 n=1 Tax=Tetrapisispora phaffii (strain ATCC 24235 / CBS 4417 / NBRC 1672 / NRRL Y-8282 / UCD 70-5) TaxID=1071381 RepID=G8BXY1_TETPH|nr:hypothetical protein TPHA_0I02580 [Tetrapisispora phaffii CBS 4417]CCE64759.1 hypothetical protein TPHA_0I02580 [Tetrapisispora phaffii CBS 4417]
MIIPILQKTARVTSFVTVAGVTATSYYYYFVHDNGYYYKTSSWKKLDDKVQNLIDGKESIRYVGIGELVDRPVDIHVRSNSETFKDIWNAEVRRAVEWLYSVGK